MARPLSEALCMHLERARDPEGSTRTVWYADYWHWECPTQEWWWRESKKSNKPSEPPGMYENGAKTASFPHLLT